MNKPFENQQPKFEGYQSDDDSFSNDKEQQLKDWEPWENPRSEVLQARSQPWYKSFWNKTVEVVSSPEAQTISYAVATLVLVHAFLDIETAIAESEVDPNDGIETATAESEVDPNDGMVG